MGRVIGIDILGGELTAGWVSRQPPHAVKTLAEKIPGILAVERDGRFLIGSHAHGAGAGAERLAFVRTLDDLRTSGMATGIDRQHRIEKTWAILLAAVKRAAERELGEEVDACVMSRPAELSYRNHARLRMAAKLAGFQWMRTYTSSALECLAETGGAAVAGRQLFISCDTHAASISACVTGDLVLEVIGEKRSERFHSTVVAAAVKALLEHIGRFSEEWRLEHLKVIHVGGHPSHAQTLCAHLPAEFGGRVEIRPNTARSRDGAALYSGVLEGRTDGLILIDAAAAWVGFNRGGVFQPVIPVGESVPRRSNHKFVSKRSDGMLEMDIYEADGFSPEIAQRGFLGKLSSEPPQGVGENLHEVAFDIDAGGVLSVKTVASRGGIKGPERIWEPSRDAMTEEEEVAIRRIVAASVGKSSVPHPASAPSSSAPAAKYDYFVSHSSKDEVYAHRLTAALEQLGKSCWIAPRNVRATEPYASEIMHGLSNAQALVLVYSQWSAASPHVLREMVIMAEARRKLAPIMIDATPLENQFAYFLAGVHQVRATAPEVDAATIMAGT